MGWQNEMVRILRYRINDLTGTTYDDERLEETILVGAQFMLNDVQLPTTYTIDVDELSLSPDPTEGTKDNTFINLAVLKAAIIVLSGEVKAATTFSMRIVDGPSSIDASQVFTTKKMLLDDLLKEYAQVKLNYLAGNSIAGQAISTPTTVDYFSGGYFPQ